MTPHSNSTTDFGFGEKTEHDTCQSDVVKPFVSDNMNKESSVNALSVAMIHQEVCRQSTSIQVDNFSLELVRIVGKVTSTPFVKTNFTTFQLNDINKTGQSINPITCKMWEVNVDSYGKSIQMLKRQKIKVTGVLYFDGSQIILNVMSVQLLLHESDVKYHNLEVQLHSLQRKVAMKHLMQNATRMSKTFQSPTDFGE